MCAFYFKIRFIKQYKKISDRHIHSLLVYFFIVFILLPLLCLNSLTLNPVPMQYHVDLTTHVMHYTIFFPDRKKPPNFDPTHMNGLCVYSHEIKRQYGFYTRRPLPYFSVDAFVGRFFLLLQIYMYVHVSRVCVFARIHIVQLHVYIYFWWDMPSSICYHLRLILRTHENRF